MYRELSIIYIIYIYCINLSKNGLTIIELLNILYFIKGDININSCL